MSSGTVPSIHRGLGFLFLGLGLVMFFLAGLGTFGESYDAHRGLGMLLILIALIMLILAAVGRRESLVPSAVLFGLMILQSALAVIGSESSSIVGALHPVNALILLFVAHQAARGLPLPIGGGQRRSGPSVTA